VKSARANPCGRRSVFARAARDEISFAVRAWAHMRARQPRRPGPFDGRHPKTNCGEEISDRILVVKRCN
jgi:hypothetical protein